MLSRSRTVGDPIFILSEKGFSFTEISYFLSQSKIDISPSCIEEFCLQEQTKRLAHFADAITGSHKPEWNDAIHRTALIERSLRQSLKDETGFFLNYQPQVDMFTGQIIGAEALVRWEVGGNGVGIVVPCKEIER